MKKGTMFAIGGLALTALGAGLNFFKGRYDEQVADEKQTEKITKAVADYMANQNQMPSKKND